MRGSPAELTTWRSSRGGGAAVAGTRGPSLSRQPAMRESRSTLTVKRPMAPS